MFYQWIHVQHQCQANKEVHFTAGLFLHFVSKVTWHDHGKIFLPENLSGSVQSLLTAVSPYVTKSCYTLVLWCNSTQLTRWCFTDHSFITEYRLVRSKALSPELPLVWYFLLSKSKASGSFFDRIFILDLTWWMQSGSLGFIQLSFKSWDQIVTIVSRGDTSNQMWLASHCAMSTFLQLSSPQMCMPYVCLQCLI